LRIVVDNADPILDLQPTAINIDVNTPITTTVYDAQATNLNSGNAIGLPNLNGINCISGIIS
jgi:hypothetical protein